MISFFWFLFLFISQSTAGLIAAELIDEAGDIAEAILGEDEGYGQILAYDNPITYVMSFQILKFILKRLWWQK